jgi:hypothetical protein
MENYSFVFSNAFAGVIRDSFRIVHILKNRPFWPFDEGERAHVDFWF